jgi:nucleotide-binding universal stress UspA family protein
MIIVKRILVPTDLSQTSDASLKYGLEFARLFGARLHLLHVAEVSTGIREYPVEPFVVGDSDVPDRLAALLTESDKRELRPVCEVRLGAPADEILEYAAEHDVDLIVMGTHGREGFARVLLGSVAEVVVRKASCPVLTVHTPEGEVVMQEVPANWCARAAS